VLSRLVTSCIPNDIKRSCEVLGSAPSLAKISSWASREKQEKFEEWLVTFKDGIDADAISSPFRQLEYVQLLASFVEEVEKWHVELQSRAGLQTQCVVIQFYTNTCPLWHNSSASMAADNANGGWRTIGGRQTRMVYAQGDHTSIVQEPFVRDLANKLLQNIE
jgi:hypothetical protein